MKLKQTPNGNYKLKLTPDELKVLASLCTVVKLDQSKSANVAFQLMEAYDYFMCTETDEYYDVTGTIGEIDENSLMVTVHDD